jgi:Ras-related protein Rab-11B
MTLIAGKQSTASSTSLAGQAPVSVDTPIFKVIVAGEGGVGKSSIVHRFVSNLNSEPVMTVGSEFAYREIEVAGQRLGLSIWDFGGEERFRELMPILCLGAHGALIVFDLTRYSTFVQLRFWLDIVHGTTNNIPVILIGAKCDLPGGPTDEEIKQFCCEQRISAYFPVSAREGVNVDSVFTHIAQLMFDATQKGFITPAFSTKSDAEKPPSDVLETPISPP